MQVTIRDLQIDRNAISKNTRSQVSISDLKIDRNAIPKNTRSHPYVILFVMNLESSLQEDKWSSSIQEP